MAMRILYLSQYFPPEAGATQTRAYEMAHAFTLLGHSITVISEFPNHPSGIIPPAYRAKLFEREILTGIEVIRVPVLASPNKDFRRRLAFYLSYMFNACLAGALLVRGHFDLIYCSSPPLFTGATGLFLSRLRRTPLVFEVRDLWPESAVALGELTNRRWIGWAERLELACYRRAHLIIAVTLGIQSRLLERGIPAEKICLVPNGANLDLFRPQPDERLRLRRELGLEDQFVAIYAGIFGIAQGLETVLQAASLLRAEPAFYFLLVGDGPQKAALNQAAAALDLPNLRILPEQPRQAIPALLSAADIALAPLRRLDLFKGALPSKIFDAWACELPVLLSIDGEARQMVAEAEAGWYIPPEDPQALAKALRQIAAQPEACRQKGKNGRAYTARYYSRSDQAKELMKLLERMLNPDRVSEIKE